MPRGQAIDSCDNCEFFVHPKQVDRHVHEKSGMLPKGRCQRFPTMIEKMPMDWCGEHREARDQ